MENDIAEKLIRQFQIRFKVHMIIIMLRRRANLKGGPAARVKEKQTMTN